MERTRNALRSALLSVLESGRERRSHRPPEFGRRRYGDEPIHWDQREVIRGSPGGPRDVFPRSVCQLRMPVYLPSSTRTNLILW